MKKRHPFLPDKPHVHSDFKAAKKAWSKRLLASDKRIVTRVSTAAGPTPLFNVVGVAIGEKLSEGKLTGIVSVNFLVRKKYPDTHVTKKDRLPKSIEGLPTDVQEVGTF